MNFKTAKIKLDWNFFRKTKADKFLFYLIIPGVILIIIGMAFKILLLYITGCCFFISISIIDFWSDQVSTYEFKYQWITDKWITLPGNDFHYICSYPCSKVFHIYDIYEYIKSNKEYKFSLLKERANISFYNIWRFTSEKEIKKYNLEIYTARILLEKDDDKYQKII